MPADPDLPFVKRPDRVAGTDSLPLLHVSAGLLLEHFLIARDPCTALGLSRQFRQISESPDLFDERLRVMYRSMAARWHQIAGRGTGDVCGIGSEA